MWRPLVNVQPQMQCRPQHVGDAKTRDDHQVQLQVWSGASLSLPYKLCMAEVAENWDCPSPSEPKGW